MDIVSILVLVLITLVVVITIIFLIPGLTGAPYVPTLKNGLELVFSKLYPIKKDDLLIDLGAGDGTILEAMKKSGARAIGLEINPILVLIMKRRFRKDKNISVKCCNFYSYSFPKGTTVIYAFAVSLHIEKIHQKIKAEATRLGHPLYFISNAFDIQALKPEKKISSFYLYKISPDENNKLKQDSKHGRKN